MTTEDIYLSLGSNLGQREANLRRAVKELNYCGKVAQISSIYVSEPWEGKGEFEFLNIACSLSTDLLPAMLLSSLREIERRMEPVRHDKWKPRIIDIDILTYGQTVWEMPGLTIPHALMPIRKFVLEPLCEIAPKWRHPVLRKSVAVLLQECPDTGKIAIYKKWG
jgi:2-amino-4-hydroxy-6-hydroxymethyldihydropteridine diphosphokinase